MKVSSEILGRGKYGVVFKGTYNSQNVAVKRVQLIDIEQTQNEETALKDLEHPNVIKLLYSESKTEFRYYVLEYCAATLGQLYLEEGNEQKYSGPSPSNKDIILQLAIGLKYIHSKNLVHRDLKPENVLIWVSDDAYNSTNQQRQSLIKLADFGLCKRTKESGSFTISSIKGTGNWLSPELLEAIAKNNNCVNTLERGTNKCDVFAEGLLFAYVLLKGKHPYRTEISIKTNILKNDPVNLNELANVYRELRHKLIDKMLKTNPDERLEASKVVQILQHLFDKPKMKLAEESAIICHKEGTVFYSIPLSKETDSSTSVERYSVGKETGHNRHNQHKTILLMGVTGAGKKPFINAMMNYIIGIEYEDTFRFQLIQETKPSSLQVYDIHHMEGFRIPFSLTIVCTPGYDDTKGLKFNDNITESICEFFEDKNGIQELDVIGFVIQASTTRLTPNQNYVFESVFSIFGADVMENIYFLLTFTDDDLIPGLIIENTTTDLQETPMDSENEEPFHYQFNNAGLFYSSHKSSRENELNDFHWHMNVENFQQFFKSMAKMKTKSANSIRNREIELRRMYTANRN